MAQLAESTWSKYLEPYVCLDSMIDKIEVISKPGNGFGKQFKPIEAEVRKNPRFGSFRPSKHYLAVGDLRQFGIDAIMHLEQRRYGTSKVEIEGTGKKSLGEICSIVEDLLDGDPLQQRVSRIDLCADVAGVPIEWFRDHVRVKRKQWLADFSDEEISNQQRMGKRFYKTLYWGKRPCCLRVYDKVEESRVRYKRWCRRTIREEKKLWGEKYTAAFEQDREALKQLHPDRIIELPDFLDWLAVDLPISQQRITAQIELPGQESPEQLECFPVVTRVENQLGGAVPEKLASLHLVRKNAEAFDPFEGLVLLSGRADPPDPFAKDASGNLLYTRMQYCAGLGIRELFLKWGAQQTWNFLDQDRHAKRILDSYREFIPDTGEPGISPAALRDRYQATVSEQLAA